MIELGFEIKTVGTTAEAAYAQQNISLQNALDLFAQLNYTMQNVTVISSSLLPSTTTGYIADYVFQIVVANEAAAAALTDLANTMAINILSYKTYDYSNAYLASVKANLLDLAAQDALNGGNVLFKKLALSPDPNFPIANAVVLNYGIAAATTGTGQIASLQLAVTYNVHPLESS